MTHTALVLLDHGDEDETPQLYSCEHSRDWRKLSTSDFLVDMIDCGEMPEDWAEMLVKYPSGFYELKFNTETETESWEMPHIRYEVLTDLVSLIPSWRARRLYHWNNLLNWVSNHFWAIFGRTWRVEWEYGGAGVARSNLFWPQALYLKYIRSPKKASWGPDFTVCRIIGPL